MNEKKNNQLHIYKLSFNYATSNDMLKERKDFPITAHSEDEARKMLHDFCKVNGSTEFSVIVGMEKGTPNNAHLRTEDYFNRELEAIKKGRK